MKIILYDWVENPSNGEEAGLYGKAFYDAQFYIVSCQSIKNLIIFGDVSKSVHFILWDVNKFEI